jgi:hypothetical protein
MESPFPVAEQGFVDRNRVLGREAEAPTDASGVDHDIAAVIERARRMFQFHGRSLGPSGTECAI